jgi:hypothetical protein
LKEIREQGGIVAFQRDLNEKSCLTAYGVRFALPAKATASDLIKITGNLSILIRFGALNGRKFDYAYYRGRYAFDTEGMLEALKTSNITQNDIAESLKKVYVATISETAAENAGNIEKCIALIDDDGRIIDIVPVDTRLSSEKRSACDKIIIMQPEVSKTEYADFLEFIITGRNESILRKRYLASQKFNNVITDQTAYYLKPVPTITREEFNSLREMIRDNKNAEKLPYYRNFFAKDVNDKLFGYGTTCPFCNFESNYVNGFSIKNFKHALMHNNTEKYFYFALYLCAEDTIISDGWVFTGITVGGKNPFTCLEEIVQAKSIPPEYLQCKLTYTIRENQCLPFGENLTQDTINISNSPEQTAEFVVSPLMLAKWAEMNG